IREEGLERAGLVVVRVTALDHRDVPALTRRLRLGQRDARVSRRRDWTLDQPRWFATWAPGQRWRWRSRGPDRRVAPANVTASAPAQWAHESCRAPVGEVEGCAVRHPWPRQRAS